MRNSRTITKKTQIRLVYLRRVEVVVVDSLSPFVLAPANNIELDIIHIRLVVDSTSSEGASKRGYRNLGLNHIGGHFVVKVLLMLKVKFWVVQIGFQRPAATVVRRLFYRIVRLFSLNMDGFQTFSLSILHADDAEAFLELFKFLDLRVDGHDVLGSDVVR